MGRFRKFWSLSGREKCCLCEAAILLPLADLCLRTVAFRHIDRFLRARWKDDASDPSDRTEDIRIVELSVSRAARLAFDDIIKSSVMWTTIKIFLLDPGMESNFILIASCGKALTGQRFWKLAAG